LAIDFEVSAHTVELNCDEIPTLHIDNFLTAWAQPNLGGMF